MMARSSRPISSDAATIPAAARVFVVISRWLNAIDPLVSIVAVLFMLTLWVSQARNGGEPGEVSKIAAGAWIACVANLLLVMGCVITERAQVLMQIACGVLLGVAFLTLFIAGPGRQRQLMAIGFCRHRYPGNK
jgi:4-amino-4-deoxy-L-arabinose transferase-like glycosyltransferase